MATKKSLGETVGSESTTRPRMMIRTVLGGIARTKEQSRRALQDRSISLSFAPFSSLQTGLTIAHNGSQTISLSSSVVSAPAAVAAAQAPAPAPPTSGREAPSAVADIFTVDDEEDADAVELPAKIDLDVTGVADEPEESKKRVAAAQLQAIENGQTRS